MKLTWWRRTGCAALTISTAVFLLLWALTAILIARSYWRADCLGIRLENLYLELSSARGRFYARISMSLPERANPFAYDKDWGWGSYRNPSRIAQNMQRRSLDFGGDRWQFLGFRTARGSHRIGNTVWLRYAEGPLWPVLAVFAIPPVGWLWRRRSWPREQQRRATRTLLLISSAPVAMAVVLLALLFINFRFLGPRETPLSGRTSHPLTPLVSDANGVTLRIMTYNIWMAGDFNSEPNEAEIRRIVDTGRFSAKLDGPFTISSYDPHAVIDYIFVPRDWQLLEHRVIQTSLSDHLPVVSTYRVPLAAESRPRIHGEDR